MNDTGQSQLYLLLFVAGLPSKATPASVQRFFSAHGRVGLLRLRSSKYGNRILSSNPQNNIKRGFCVLEASDEVVFYRILNLSGIYYEGRRLIITVLREKEDFSHYAESLIKRKVYIPKVPKIVSVSDLTQALTQLYGEVRKVAQTRDPNSSDGSAFLYSHYGVEFMDEQSATEAIDRRQITIQYAGGGVVTLQVSQYLKARIQPSLQHSIPHSEVKKDGTVNQKSKIIQRETIKDVFFKTTINKETRTNAYDSLKPTSCAYHNARVYAYAFQAGSDYEHSFLRFNALLRYVRR